MKRTKLIMMIAVGGALIFSGCKKDDNNTVTPRPVAALTSANTGSSAIADPNIATINYTLTANFPNQSAGVQWNSGYITTSELIFNGTHVVGNMLSQTQFPSQVVQTVQLSKLAALGSVPLPSATFDYGSFSIMLSQSGQEHGLFISGVYAINNQQVPVEIMVDNPVQIMSNYINGPLVFTPQSYTAALSLNIDQLTSGINANNLANASVTNGVILISAVSNGALYQQIISNINNLQTIMTVKFQVNATITPTTTITPSALPVIVRVAA